MVGQARAIAAERDVGSLEPGKRADVVIRRAGTPDAQPAVDPVFQLALLSRASSVDTVIVDVRIVLRDGRSTLVDEEVVFANVRASVGRMLGRLGLRSG
jgi:5-methylthioadenosine/S-adenosylhomocysteine deaminase